MKKNKYLKYLALALTIFVVSPLDDIIFASLFGTALFSFGTIGFFLFLIPMTIVSVLMWKKRPRRAS